jgi:hypothetical protein
VDLALASFVQPAPQSRAKEVPDLRMRANDLAQMCAPTGV